MHQIINKDMRNQDMVCVWSALVTWNCLLIRLPSGFWTLFILCICFFLSSAALQNTSCCLFESWVYLGLNLIHTVSTQKGPPPGTKPRTCSLWFNDTFKNIFYWVWQWKAVPLPHQQLPHRLHPSSPVEQRPLSSIWWNTGRAIRKQTCWQISSWPIWKCSMAEVIILKCPNDNNALVFHALYLGVRMSLYWSISTLVEAAREMGITMLFIL